MKSNLLFPPVFRIIGLVLALPGLALGYLLEYTNYVIRFLRYRNELAITLVVTGLIFIGFSRLKNEDEETNKLRLNALYWSVLADGMLLTVSFILQFLGDQFKIQGLRDLPDLFTFHLFILLFIFVGRFYYWVYKARKNKKDTPLYLLPYHSYNLVFKIASVCFITLLIAAQIFSPIDTFVASSIAQDLFLLFPVCLLIWIWSKEKNEIGPVTNERLKAMQLAVYINYGLFLIATWYVYGIDYLVVLFVGLMSIPIIFLIVFYFQLYRLRKKHTQIGLSNL